MNLPFSIALDNSTGNIYVSVRQRGRFLLLDRV